MPGKKPQPAGQAQPERGQLLSVVENLNVFVGMSDLQLRPFYVNDPGLRMVGLRSLEEATKVSVMDFFFPEDREFIQQKFLPEVLRQGRGEVEVRFRHFQTGEALWMIYNVFALRRAGGESLGFATISQDITRQKRVQEELQEKSLHLERLSHEFQVILDTSPLGVISFGLDREVRSWNQAAERIFGWKASEIIGHRLRVPASAQAQWRELLAGLLHGQAYINVETRRVRKDGTEFDAQVSAAPVRNPQGEVSGIIGLVTDATEMVQSREALQRAEKLAAAGRLAATIAHEMNNPLEAVMNLVYLARHESHEEGVSQKLSLADEELRRVAHIARRALGFYRESTAPVPCKLVELVESVLKLYERHLHQRHIEVQREYRTHDQLIALEGELRHMVSNVISNARDALADGGLLRVRVTHSPGKAGLRLTVADNGSGIPHAHLKKVFEPFFTTKKDVGVGLGMWLSHEIVRRHGGSIRLHSSDRSARHGTAVSIFLPFDNSWTARVAQAPPERKGSAAAD